MTPEEKLAAKRANEGVEAFVAMLNNLAVGTIVAGLLSPWVSRHPEPL